MEKKNGKPFKPCLVVVAAVAATGAMAALPAGYAELEYIESTGTQYIDTGVTITPTMAVEADAQFTEITTYQQRIFGNSHNGTSDTDGDLGTGHLNFDIYIQGQGYFASALAEDKGDWVRTNTKADKNRHTHRLDCTDRKYYLDGTVQTTHTQTPTKSTNGSLFIFANNCVSTNYSKIRLYSSKIYDNGEVVHDYVPARRLSDSALGLYDVEDGVFLPNAGSGKFNPGPAILKPLAWPGGKPRTNAFEKSMEISVGEGMVPGADVFTNFQALVHLSEARQSGFLYADCGEQGSGIRFTMPDGTLLAHELATRDVNGESLVWVNISNLTASTKFRMYWKPKSGAALPVVEPALTWPGYAGVWHFNDAYPTNAADSSANHYDAIATSATDVTQIDGKVGKTYHHATANPYKTGIAAAVLGGIANVQNFTISGWLKADSSACGFAILAFKGGYSEPGWGINMQNKDTQITFRSSSSTLLFSPNCPSITSWQHFTCVYTWGGTVILYSNGANKQSNSGRVYAGESPGVEFTFANNLIGSSDELRIRNGATSDAHALADYKTQTDAGFLVYGDVETQRGAFFLYLR